MGLWCDTSTYCSFVTCRYPNLATAQAAVSQCGDVVGVSRHPCHSPTTITTCRVLCDQIAANGVPADFGPMVFTFAGDGKVVGENTCK